MNKSWPAKRLGYLSSAPRVSTHADSEEGGPRSHVLGVVKGFEALGWQVQPYIVGDRLPPVFRGRGSVHVASRSWANRLAADVVRWGIGWYATRDAWRELGSRVDLVYERMAVLTTLGGVFQRHGIPWVLETNALAYVEGTDQRRSIALARLAKRNELSAYRRCDVLVCVSETLKALVVEAAGIAEEKVLVVPNGVDARFFDPSKVAPHRLFPEFTVGFVGSLYPWQGLDGLLRAIRDLRDEGVRICAVIVGDGMMRETWEALAVQLGVTDQIRFVGRVPRDEVRAYIAGFDLGFSGQTAREGGTAHFSPLKIYEYLAMGKPVIASTASGDAVGTIQPGKTGFLFQANDLEALKRALRDACAWAPKVTELASGCRTIAIARHSWDSRVRTMLTDVEAILSRGTWSGSA